MCCAWRLSISSAGNLPPSHLRLDRPPLFILSWDWLKPRRVHLSVCPLRSSCGWPLTQRQIIWIKYSRSQVVSLAESCSQASSTAEKRISGCTPKKGKPCHVMQRTVFMLRWAFLVRTLKWGSSETAEELLCVRRIHLSFPCYKTKYTTTKKTTSKSTQTRIKSDIHVMPQNKEK